MNDPRARDVTFPSSVDTKRVARRRDPVRLARGDKNSFQSRDHDDEERSRGTGRVVVRSFVCRESNQLIQSNHDDDVDEKRVDDVDGENDDDGEKNDDDVLCATTGEPKNTAGIRDATKRNVFKGDGD